MATGSKQYGLSVPKKGTTVVSVVSGTLRPRLACFDDDSDSDKEKGSGVGKTLQREGERSIQKKQTQLQMKRALDEDPTVYQYDEVYETMEQKKAETVAKKKDQAKKPKYIEGLLKSAERRKMENERRVEREVQREREEEGAMFADKESFVTSAYRAKLEEFRLQEEKEKLEAMLEDRLDVSKQKDLSGFYRHLYRETVAKEPEDTDKTVDKPDEALPIKEEPVDTEDTTGDNKPEGEKGATKTRKYRERHQSSSSSSSGSNDSSSSGSGSSSSSDSDSEGPSKDNDKKEVGSKEPEKEEVKPEAPRVPVTEEKEKEKAPIPVEPPKPKVNIWIKRTVGPVYEEALQRYYARKAARES